MIHIQTTADAVFGQYIAQNSYSQLVVLVDNNTKKHCYPSIKSLLPAHKVVEIKAGEEHKNIETCSTIWAKFTALQLDRHALVLLLGGGVIGDMGGFCAALYKRGIRFVQIPTTLLAQVDASVGGKTAIDFQGFKNQIGLFSLPVSVWIFTDFLQTLPERELRSGFAEIIKHCLIADASEWSRIRRKDLHQQKLLDLVQHSVAIKKNITEQDPTEQNIRKWLNFGHTIGHAVESYFLTKPKKEQLLHGEAIAIGMICESYLSFTKGHISLGELSEIEEFTFSCFGQVTITEADIKVIAPLVFQDKKNKNGKILCTLLQGIGKAQHDQEISLNEIKKALQFYGK